MNLWTLKKGEAGQVTQLSESLSEDFKLRLVDLGIHVGETLQCVQAPGFGAPRSYLVNNTVYSLDKEISEQIQISKLGEA